MNICVCQKLKRRVDFYVVETLAVNVPNFFQLRKLL